MQRGIRLPLNTEGLDLWRLSIYRVGMQTIPVALTRHADYLLPGIQEACARLMGMCEMRVSAGAKVLVKPNLVSAKKGSLSCSEPAFVAAVCALLLDAGAKVGVADSPAFGSGAGVAEKSGLAAALQPLGLSVKSLGNPVPHTLSSGGRIGISREALEADLIFNVPRLKAHSQLFLTAGVKNLFGCVPGIHKALAHSRFGEKGDAFESMILDVMEALPTTFTILDAVTAMHETGPMGGKPYPLGVMGASHDPVAIDTAVYMMLGLSSQDVPLWKAAQKRNFSNAFSEHLVFPELHPEDIAANGFLLPGKLDTVSFNPYRIARGAVKRVAALLR